MWTGLKPLRRNTYSMTVCFWFLRAETSLRFDKQADAIFDLVFHEQMESNICQLTWKANWRILSIFQWMSFDLFLRAEQLLFCSACSSNEITFENAFSVFVRFVRYRVNPVWCCHDWWPTCPFFALMLNFITGIHVKSYRGCALLCVSCNTTVVLWCQNRWQPAATYHHHLQHSHYALLPFSNLSSSAWQRVVIQLCTIQSPLMQR